MNEESLKNPLYGKNPDTKNTERRRYAMPTASKPIEHYEKRFKEASRELVTLDKTLQQISQHIPA